MSSHHIVRDEQEPALFIQQLHAVPSERLGHLLEWSPTVMITSDQVDQALGRGFKVDVVLCHRQELEALRSKLLHQVPIHFLTIPRYEESIPRGLDHLVASKHKAVYLVTNFSAQLVKRLSFHLTSMQVTIIDGDFKWYFVDRKFKKWGPPGQVFRTMTKDLRVKIEPTPNVKWEKGYFEFSPKQEGFVEVGFSKPFWLGEKIIGPQSPDNPIFTV